MAATPTSRRRRARRGSVERPVNGRLYRTGFLVAALPLVILAFSIVRPAPLPAPLLPANFDGTAARALATDLATHYPDRSPGGASSLRAAQWFRDQMARYGLPVSDDTWQEQVAGKGRVRLQNLWAVAGGQSPEAIVVLANRDNDGSGPGADNNASGTAALVELARDYARQAGSSQAVKTAHTLVFLSTDGGAYGNLGAARFAKKLPFKVVAAVNLTAIGSAGRPRIEIAGDLPRSPAAALVETASRRVLEQTGVRADRVGALGQLIDLGFPFTLYGQGPLVAAGVPTVTLTTAGARPPSALADRASELDARRLGQVGRATQQLIGSLDQGLGLAQGTTAYLWIGDRVVRGWAIELLLVSLLAPPFIVIVDLFAHLRRRRIPLLPALRSLRSRLFFWLYLGVCFGFFRLLGWWPQGTPRPPDPGSEVAGDWPVIALIALALLGLLGWLVARQRLVPRRPVTAEERLAGDTAALIGLAIVALLVVATNPFALLFFLPALHAWIWLPQSRRGRPPARVVFFLLGLVGPALIIGSLAFRFGLGFDAVWYLLLLAAIGFVHLPALVITLCAGACTAQLAMVAMGRYAPYPGPRERPARGPVRELVRAVAGSSRARRRTQDDRRAHG